MTEQNGLSDREIEILNLLATGVSNKEIAQQLFISPNTVKVHLRNIYAKLEVASRTEATLYAIREGFVNVTSESASEPVENAFSGTPLVESQVTRQVEGTDSPLTPGADENALSAFRSRFLWISLIVVLAVVGGGAISMVWSKGSDSPTPSIPTPPPAGDVVGWELKAPLSVARSGLAVTTYGAHIYAIGGDSSSGVTGIVERYDPELDNWDVLTPKPIPVADVKAETIGGRIFVPGGRKGDGQVTDILEIYDPAQDRWSQGAPLPVAVSAYAMVAFEGKLYLFGGWDGSQYLASVYEYDPAEDQWQPRMPMPTARGYAGAAVGSDRIFVIGGINVSGVLSENEEFLPAQEGPDAFSWLERAPIPEGRYGMGVVSIVEAIHVIGGEGQADVLSSFRYNPQQDNWQALENPVVGHLVDLGLVLLNTDLYVVGGRLDDTLSKKNLSYQVLYSIVIPVIVP